MIPANIENRLAEALGQEPFETLDVQTDQKIELVAILLQDARSNRANACPSTRVLPPGTLVDRLQWLDTGPDLNPQEAFARLVLSPQAGWDAIVRAVYARFEDHWAAGVAYHH